MAIFISFIVFLANASDLGWIGSTTEEISGQNDRGRPYVCEYYIKLFYPQLIR